MQRDDAVAELAEKILSIAEEKYAEAPKLMLPGDTNPPPPIQWHVAYTAAQLVEPLLRLLVVRKIQVQAATSAAAAAGGKIVVPKGFNDIVSSAVGEVGRAMNVFGIELAQGI